jgi:mevalonate kinase
MPIAAEMERYYSHGKLLLSGEYFVLDGALALAVPTRRGQSLTVESQPTTKPPSLHWESYTHDGNCWFSGRFSLPGATYEAGTDPATGQRLEQILKAGRELQARIWQETAHITYSVRTDLEFPRNWGLGSSSTLIANLAKWWEVDAYQLLAKTFGGSGYDLACADAAGALFYRLQEGKPVVSATEFNPPFKDQLYFLYLEKKQNSRAGISQYREKGTPPVALTEEISAISRELPRITTLKRFVEQMEAHERLVSEWIGIRPVGLQHFADFPGSVKSLGAWGGDFVLVASDLPFRELSAYFSALNYRTLIPFGEMVLPGSS